jgi:hypothetical protein
MFWLIEQGGIALDMQVPGRGDQIVETLGPGTVLGPWLHRPTAGISVRWRLATTAIAFDATSFAVAVTPSAFSYTMLHFTPVSPATADDQTACWTCMPPVPGEAADIGRTHDQ